MSDAEPAIDPIVRGLTRPAMMWGVPYVVFTLNLTATVLVFINSKNLLMFFLFAPLHAVSYWLTIKDVFFIDILTTRFRTCPFTRNRAFWGGDSYSV